MSNGGSAAQMLRGFVDEIEEIEIELAEIKAKHKDAYQRLKVRGFSAKIVRKLIKERQEPPQARLEFEAQCEVYRGSLGMLAGRPLSDDARAAFKPQPSEAEVRPPNGDEIDGTAKPEHGAQSEMPVAAPKLGPEQIEKSNDEGRLAARDGKQVLDNPYMAGDPRRAAWDEGWCLEAGSDGMEIPAAYRPKPKPKPGDGKPGDGATPPQGGVS